MAALTLAQQFGANATISSGVLSIQLSDLTGVGLNGSSPSASDISAALIMLWERNQPTNADTDPTVGILVSKDFTPKQFTTRGDVSQIEYRYSVYAYTPDSTSTLDPDSVV